VRPPLLGTHPHRQSIPHRLLLALRTRGHHRAGQEIRGVPVPCQANPPTCARATDHSTHLAIRRLGPRHPGSIPTSARGLPLPLRRHWQVHQVGRDGARAHNTGQVGCQVHPRIGVPFWCAQPYHNWQWQSIHQRPIPRVLCLHQHQDLICLSCLPQEQWTGWTRKCRSLQGPQDQKLWFQAQGLWQEVAGQSPVYGLVHPN
jgi:hypothetical protein